MHQRGRNVSLFDRRVNVLGTTAANAIDEVREMVASRLARGSGFSLIGEPGLVGIVPIDPKVSIGPVKNVADGVGLRVLRSQRLPLAGLLVVSGRQSGSRYSCASVGAGSDLGLVVSNPMTNFDLHHLALPVGVLEIESGI